MRGVVVAVCVAVSGCGIGIGVRSGTQVSRTSEPVTLTNSIGSDTIEADGSLSGSWAELETIGSIKVLRASIVVGGGNSHGRFRTASPMPQPIFAADDNFATRFGAGVGLASPITFGQVRPVAMLRYTGNIGAGDNVVQTIYELGLELEIDQVLSERSTSTFVGGVSLIRESGKSYADFGSLSSYEGDFSTSGVLVKFGWHFMIDGNR